MKIIALYVAFLLAFSGSIAAMQAKGNAEAGKSEAAMCAGCHGAAGNSQTPQWPSIAGQHESYLLRQLMLIKSGDRPVSEMASMVGSFSEESLADIAAYFSQQKVRRGPISEKVNNEAHELWTEGNAGAGLQACSDCHGKSGEGDTDLGYPALAGQQAQYTTRMLRRFRSGETWGAEDSPSQLMAKAASQLTNEQIEAVSTYIQGLYADTH